MCSWSRLSIADVRTSLQLIQAIPFDTSSRYLVRDRDGVYGQRVIDSLEMLDIEQKVTAPRSPWRNGYCERVTGGWIRMLPYIGPFNLQIPGRLRASPSPVDFITATIAKLPGPC
jgi:transposase InsO family protein